MGEQSDKLPSPGDEFPEKLLRELGGFLADISEDEPGEEELESIWGNIERQAEIEEAKRRHPASGTPDGN